VWGAEALLEDSLVVGALLEQALRPDIAGVCDSLFTDLDGVCDSFFGVGKFIRRLEQALRVEAAALARPLRVGLRVEGRGSRVQGSEFRVQDSGFRAQGSGCRVQGSGRDLRV